MIMVGEKSISETEGMKQKEESKEVYIHACDCLSRVASQV